MDLTARLERQLSSPKGRLSWFLNFLNLDIDSIPRLDLIALDYGLHALRDEIDLKREPDPEKVFADDPQRRGELKEIQNLLREVLEGIFACKDKIIPGPKGESSLQRARRLSKRFMVKSFQTELHLSIKGEKLIVKAAKEIDQLFLQFVNDLSQFSVDAIRVCDRPDCLNFFLKRTQKEKKYCSDKCAWVMNSRIRRAENPDKDREKKRKSYERKIAREIPGAKVTRKQRTIKE
jgi:hypothetical protein